LLRAGRVSAGCGGALFDALTEERFTTGGREGADEYLDGTGGIVSIMRIEQLCGERTGRRTCQGVGAFAVVGMLAGCGSAGVCEADEGGGADHCGRGMWPRDERSCAAIPL
jgi:hypothetical protein